MRYLKIYENYFLEKDKVKETSKKLDNDFEQEILDLIPDISSIDSFKYTTTQIFDNSYHSKIIEFEFDGKFEKFIPVKYYKDIVISDLHRLNNILSKEYTVLYSIEFRIYTKKEISIAHISRDNLNRVNFNSIKEVIKNINSNYDNLINKFKRISLDNEVSFSRIRIHLRRL